MQARIDKGIVNKEMKSTGEIICYHFIYTLRDFLQNFIALFTFDPKEKKR